MHLTDQALETFLPGYLRPDVKNRLQSGLKSFFNDETPNRERNYSGFYLLNAPLYLMQSDVVQSVRAIEWDLSIHDYVLCYTPAMILSNTCDITPENIRNANVKQVMLAPIIPLDEYEKDLRKAQIGSDQLRSFLTTLRRQELSNIFYLPPNHRNGKEYMVVLDKAFWQPLNAIETINSNLQQQRFLSLSHWGFYLFLLKISYHWCRLPETDDRQEN